MEVKPRSSTNANTVAVAKITVERGWRVGKKVSASCFVVVVVVIVVVVVVLLTRRSRVRKTKCVLGHPKARAASYYLLPDTL